MNEHLFGDNYGLVVEGTTFTIIQNELQEEFAKIFPYFQSVIVCRASPSQKSHVVQLVKKYIPSATSMSIGDGSNDVPMIKQANIGVGIKGKEGTEAAANSDYSIAQFKFVRTLLFNHGRPFAYRFMLFILIFLHSQFFISMNSFMLGLYSAYSGQKPWEDLMFIVYQTVFTNLNIGMYLGFDRDMPRQKDDTTAIRLL